MSSHHIVRDEQEPALLALNAGWLRNETLASLLEWSPTIVVPTDQLEIMATLGIKPDVVVATNEEATELAESWEAFAPVTVLERRPGESIPTASLHFLVAKKHRAVNIFASPFDLPFDEFGLFFENLDIVFYTDVCRWLWLRSGKYNKWLPAGTRLNVSPLNVQQQFKVKGFVGSTSSQVQVSELEVEKDDVVSIFSAQPFLLQEQL